MKELNARELYNLHKCYEDNKIKKILESENAEDEKSDEDEKLYNKIQNKQEENDINERKKVGVKKELKELLVGECLYQIYNKALGYNTEYLIEGDELKRRALVNGFIKESNIYSLLNSFKGKTLLLSEYYTIINKTYNKILEKAKINNEEIIIEPEEKDEFIADITNKEADKVAEAIADRVLSSVQSFIISNQETKQQVMEILNKAQEKVDSTVKENLQETYISNAKQQVSALKYNKSRNILEFMVEKIGKEVYKNEGMKTNYLNENNKLNIDKVMESAIEIYTFLETLNTMNIIKIDEEYIKSFMKDF